MVSKDSKGVLDIEMGFFSNIVGSLFFLAGGPGGLGHEGQTEIYDFYFRFAKNHQMVQCTGVAIFLEGLNFTFSKISNGERTQMYGENPLLGRLGALYSSGGTLFFFCKIRAFCEVPNLLWSSYSEKVVCQVDLDGFGMMTGFIFCPDEQTTTCCRCG